MKINLILNLMKYYKRIMNFNEFNNEKEFEESYSIDYANFII